MRKPISQHSSGKATPPFCFSKTHRANSQDEPVLVALYGSPWLMDVFGSVCQLESEWVQESFSRRPGSIFLQSDWRDATLFFWRMLSSKWVSWSNQSTAQCNLARTKQALHYLVRKTGENQTGPTYIVSLNFEHEADLQRVNPDLTASSNIGAINVHLSIF